MCDICCETDLGFELPHGSCSEDQGATAVSQPVGHLSSRSVYHSGHGSEHCPWVVVVQPGKTIDLYVIDFSLTSRYHDIMMSAGGNDAVKLLPTDVVDDDDDDDDDEYCHVYALVRELPGEGQDQRQVERRSQTDGKGQRRGHSRVEGQGQVERGQGHEEVKVCAGNIREHLAYRSTSNALSVRLSSLVFADPTANFLLKYVGNFVSFPIPLIV